VRTIRGKKLSAVSDQLSAKERELNHQDTKDTKIFKSDLGALGVLAVRFAFVFVLAEG
jgi:hypothetical protein